MDPTNLARPIEILLVEDNPGDVELTAEALRAGKISNQMNVVEDGESAMAFLRKQGDYAGTSFPDVILLDLNLPRKDGREVLEEIKADPLLKKIPVIILTTSQAEEDILRAYNLAANCYITKPVDLDQFTKVVQAIEEFWFTVVKLPPNMSSHEDASGAPGAIDKLHGRRHGNDHPQSDQSPSHRGQSGRCRADSRDACGSETDDLRSGMARHARGRNEPPLIRRD
jgi:CheY-like chemotaxis protein